MTEEEEEGRSYPSGNVGPESNERVGRPRRRRLGDQAPEEQDRRQRQRRRSRAEQSPALRIARRMRHVQREMETSRRAAARDESRARQDVLPPVPGTVRAHLQDLSHTSDYVYIRHRLINGGFVVRKIDTVTSTEFYATDSSYTASFHSTEATRNLTILSLTDVVVGLLQRVYAETLAAVEAEHGPQRDDRSARFEISLSVSHDDLDGALDAPILPLCRSLANEVVNNLADTFYRFLRSSSPESSFHSLQLSVVLLQSLGTHAGRGYLPILSEDDYLRKRLTISRPRNKIIFNWRRESGCLWTAVYLALHYNLLRRKMNPLLAEMKTWPERSTQWHRLNVQRERYQAAIWWLLELDSTKLWDHCQQFFTQMGYTAGELVPEPPNSEGLQRILERLHKLFGVQLHVYAQHSAFFRTMMVPPTYHVGWHQLLLVLASYPAPPGPDGWPDKVVPGTRIKLTEHFHATLSLNALSGSHGRVSCIACGRLFARGHRVHSCPNRLLCPSCNRPRLFTPDRDPYLLASLGSETFCLPDTEEELAPCQRCGIPAFSVDCRQVHASSNCKPTKTCLRCGFDIRRNQPSRRWVDEEEYQLAIQSQATGVPPRRQLERGERRDLDEGLIMEVQEHLSSKEQAKIAEEGEGPRAHIQCGAFECKHCQLFLLGRAAAEHQCFVKRPKRAAPCPPGLVFYDLETYQAGGYRRGTFVTNTVACIYNPKRFNLNSYATVLFSEVEGTFNNGMVPNQHYPLSEEDMPVQSPFPKGRRHIMWTSDPVDEADSEYIDLIARTQQGLAEGDEPVEDAQNEDAYHQPPKVIARPTQVRRSPPPQAAPAAPRPPPPPPPGDDGLEEGRNKVVRWFHGHLEGPYPSRITGTHPPASPQYSVDSQQNNHHDDDDDDDGNDDADDDNVDTVLEDGQVSVPLRSSQSSWSTTPTPTSLPHRDVGGHVARAATPELDDFATAHHYAGYEGAEHSRRDPDNSDDVGEDNGHEERREESLTSPMDTDEEEEMEEELREMDLDTDTLLRLMAENEALQRHLEEEEEAEQARKAASGRIDDFTQRPTLWANKAMDAFVSFMLAKERRGYNFLAHNARGFDTLLVARHLLDRGFILRAIFSGS